MAPTAPPTAPPIGGRWWWGALAAAWTASTLLAWPLLHDDAYVGSPLLSAWIAQLTTWITAGVPTVHATLVPKLLTIAASAATLVMAGALGRPSATSRTHGLLALGLVLVFAAPTSQRWLQDGSEIGVLVAAALACGWAIDRWLGAAPTSERVLLLGVAAALPAVLRVDAAPIGIATLLAARALDRRAWGPALATCLALVLPVWGWTWLAHGSLMVTTTTAASGWPTPAEIALALEWTNPWWIVGPVALLVLVARRHPFGRLGAFGLLPLVAAVWPLWFAGDHGHSAHAAELLPSLAFAWAIALVVERHTGALARRLELRRGRRLWIGALAIGLAHVAVSWPSMRAHFGAAAVEIPTDATARVPTLP